MCFFDCRFPSWQQDISPWWWTETTWFEDPSDPQVLCDADPHVQTQVEAIAIRVEAIATSYKKLLERKITFFHPSCQSGFKGLSMRGRWKIH